jgi:uncharacterized protein YaaN involved in tellurite resistance
MEIDPVTYPTAKLGEEKVELKFRMYDIIHLYKEYKINIFEPQNLKGIEAFERVATMVEAATAYHWSKNAEEISKLIDFADFAAICGALQEAQKKVSPESAKFLAEIAARKADPEATIN